MTFTDYIFQYAKDSEGIAVIDKEEITYKSIYLKVLNTAYMLKSSKNNGPVLLMSENSIFFIICYFSVIKSGRICIPINPSISLEDIEYIINELSITDIFIQYKLLNKIKEINKNLINVYTEKDIEYISYESNIKDDLNEEDQPNIDGEDTAVILFTSGSTAKPKGVMLSHNNLIYNTNSIVQYLNLTSKDRVEVVLPFYYCYGTSLLHTHFRVCGSLVINNKFMFPQTVIDDINKYKCTGFAGVPSTFQILLKMTNIKEGEFPSLRYITQAGGRLPNIFIKELMNMLKEVDIYIMYGQTEATARLSYLPPDLLEHKLGSIGKGIPGTELKVINDYGQEVKPGEIGHIVARGKNIMKGYFNDKEETNKVLKNGCLYTGDLGIVDEDGYIYIIAREKNIIKSGGNRISPKEIEDVILEIEDVLECVVIGVEDDTLGEAVKAVVVCKGSITVTDIQTYCKDKLPRYKVPKYIKFISSLPKNSSGKILFNKL
ncbi:acyl-CoA synthetase (AMP-forming)/AMP-acid ligase II [Clostridium pascui]|uniref:AMP-binding protein n=1 Tax=Clostridium pascui TaxID=46609 RepID=UPI0019570C1A|nr:AMP-binding protein [Clostridium pascui]MBM7870364.1 acyl-CoA synthetase (AMP-forming)/AMP-acid ligase II [Clostridium pascui]